MSEKSAETIDTKKMSFSEKKSALKREWQAFFRLLPFLWPSDVRTLRLRVGLALFCLFLAKLCAVYVPLIFRDAVDSLSFEEGKLLAIPIGIILSYGTVRVLSIVFAEAREWLFVRVAQRATRLVALRIFRHVHLLSMRFHLQRQTGGLNRHIERGVRGIEFMLQSLLFHMLPTIIEIFLVFMILWGLFSFWFALILITTIGSYIYFTFLATEWRLRFRRRMNDKDAEANHYAIDSLINYETVKYFNNEEHEARRYDSAMQQYEQAAIMSVSSLSLVNIGQNLIISLGLIAILTLSAKGVVTGHYTVGDFVLVGAYMLQLYAPLGYLGFVYRQTRQSLYNMDNMFDLLETEQEITDRPNALETLENVHEISFQEVYFHYDKERPILKNINFKISEGRKLAIVGPSGSGKSTLIRLLFRFYDINSGNILIDGYDIRNIAQSSLREVIGIVPQDTVLFNDSIYYNIAYGRPEALPSEVEAAAKHAEIHATIMDFPDGYQTLVGERGLKLSGGEKQRIAIARTLLKKPDIIVFDEATSSLDSQTEKEIQKTLEHMFKGRTKIVIAHRLSTIIDADEIIVLDKGEIVECGTHQTLLNAKGLYEKLWQKQKEKQQKENQQEKKPEGL